MKNTLVIGIPWYRPEDWARVKSIMPDAGKLHDTFAEWEREARRTEREVRRQRQRVERVMLDLDAFLAWCTIRGRPSDAAARAEYACHAVQQRAMTEE